MVLSGTSFLGSSLRNTEWGYDGLDIIDDITINEHSYSQRWTTNESKSDPASIVNLRRTDLANATFTVHDTARSPDKLNSSTTDPVNYPLAAFARLEGMRIRAWNKSADQAPTFIAVTNQSSHDISILNMTTHLFRPWNGILKRGESFQAWGTTAWFRGDDLTFDIPGANIVANNPPLAQANVKVNGQEVDWEDTIRYSGGGVYVHWLGNDNGAKNWEIKLVD